MVDINYTESTDDSYENEYVNGIKKRMLGELSRIIKDEYSFFEPYKKELFKELISNYESYMIPHRMDMNSLSLKISRNRKQLKQLKTQIEKPANQTNIKKIVFHVEGRTEKLTIDSEHAVVCIIDAIKKDKHLADYFENVDTGIQKDGRVSEFTTGVLKKISTNLLKFINTGDGNDFKSEASKYKFIASFINIIREELGQDTISDKYIQSLIKKG